MYTEAINEDGKDHTLFTNRSAAYHNLKKYDEAILDAEIAIKLAPTWTKGYFRKGLAL